MAIQENTPMYESQNHMTLRVDEDSVEPKEPEEEEPVEEVKTLLELWHDNYWMVNFSPTYTI